MLGFSHTKTASGLLRVELTINDCPHPHGNYKEKADRFDQFWVAKRKLDSKWQSGNFDDDASDSASSDYSDYYEDDEW